MEKARRQARLQQVEALFDPLDFDVAAARSFGQVVAAATAAGRSHRSRVADLLIAAVAHANKPPLYTRHPQDFAGLSALLRSRRSSASRAPFAFPCAVVEVLLLHDDA